MPPPYLDFDLLIERSGERYRSHVLNSPVGQAAAEFDAPMSRLELENFILRIGRSIGEARRDVRRLESSEREAARGLGGRLFDAVFRDEVLASFRASLNEAFRRGSGLRIRLRLGDAPELAEWPWEYLYNPAQNRFFTLSPDTPVVRYLELPEEARPLAVRAPLRVLVMISSPVNYPKLDVAEEWRKLEEAIRGLQAQEKVVVDRLHEANLAALQRQLRRGAYHVFHFIGHGGFVEAAQDGALVMEDEHHRGRLVSGSDLGTMLQGHRSMRLVILNACEGARAAPADPFAGTAQGLVQQGIPAVIAMQFEITDRAAITLSQEFYGSLADGYPVDAALTEARRAIFASGNEVEWATPVLYMRTPNGRLFRIDRRPRAEPTIAPAAAPPAPEQPDYSEAAGRPAEPVVSPAADLAPVSPVERAPEPPIEREPEPELGPAVEASAEPGVVTEPEAVTETEAATELEGQAKPEVVAEPEVVAKPEVLVEPGVVAEREVVAKPEVVVEPEVAEEPEVVARPGPSTAPEAAGQPEPEPAPEPAAVAASAPQPAVPRTSEPAWKSHLVLLVLAIVGALLVLLGALVPFVSLDGTLKSLAQLSAWNMLEPVVAAGGVAVIVLLLGGRRHVRWLAGMLLGIGLYTALLYVAYFMLSVKKYQLDLGGEPSPSAGAVLGLIGSILVLASGWISLTRAVDTTPVRQARSAPYLAGLALVVAGAALVVTGGTVLTIVAVVGGPLAAPLIRLPIAIHGSTLIELASPLALVNIGGGVAAVVAGTLAWEPRRIGPAAGAILGIGVEMLCGIVAFSMVLRATQDASSSSGGLAVLVGSGALVLGSLLLHTPGGPPPERL